MFRSLSCAAIPLLSTTPLFAVEIRRYRTNLLGFWVFITNRRERMCVMVRSKKIFTTWLLGDMNTNSGSQCDVFVRKSLLRTFLL